MTTRAPRRAVAALACSLLVLGAGCGADEQTDPASPVAVELEADVPGDLAIGVLMSVTSEPGEGSQWRDAAEGAVVAVRRFALGGAEVELFTSNDKGSAEGAAKAVGDLAERGVAGIVVATSGDHVGAAVEAAGEAGVPVLLPYADAGDEGKGSWTTGPDPEAADLALAEQLEAAGADRPFLIDAGGGIPAGIDPGATRRFAAGDDATPLGRLIARRVAKGGRFDAVVVSGPAVLQADVVQALQGAGVDLPTYLTPDALSPAFAASLVGAGGSLSGEYFTVGLDVGDPTALRPTDSGRALAGYFAALRLIAADADARDLLGERSFADVAGAADARTHDAVVALVRAAEEAGSADPAEVAGELARLTLGHADGLAGPELAFRGPTAVAGESVVALQATAQETGMRPDAETGRLAWFRVPTG